jgi:peptide/nickel transport system permease protein
VGRFGFVAKRLLQMVPVVLGVSIVAFFLIHLIPGDPVAVMLTGHYSAAADKSLRASLGLDKPLWTQYLIFMGRLAHGNLGDSVFYQQPVRDLLGDKLVTTGWLIGYAAVLSILVSLPLAAVAALRKQGVVDQVIRGFFMVSLAMPSFWVGIMLVLVFSVHWHVFPASGFGDGVGDHLYHLLLPALTIAMAFSAILIRSLRNSILGVLQADYVDTARAKGLSGRRILVWHVLRNALLASVTIFGVNIAFLTGATVVVENVFSLGGIGQLLVSAIFASDYPVVQGITLVLALFVVLINLLTDVIYAALDPRVSYD